MDNHRLAFTISDVARLMRIRFDENARAIGVTRPQWRLLLLLSRAPAASQTMLADRLEVERITLCRMIDRLQERGYVERRADPADRRIWRIFLTAEGEEIVGRLNVIANTFQEELVAVLEPGEGDRLEESLVKLRDALSRRGEDVSCTA